MGVIKGRIGMTDPMGASLHDDGVSFRTWAPNALSVAVVAHDALSVAQAPGWVPADSDMLEPLGDGTWGGFLQGLSDGDPYLFFITGQGSDGWKRDPYARELTAAPPFPNSFCIVRDPTTYPWRHTSWRPPAFSDFIIYQLHVGTWWAQDKVGADVRLDRTGTFLDVASKLDHIAALGFTAIQLLPIQEFETAFGLGYNGCDLFSPEQPYCVPPEELDWRLDQINAAFARFGKEPLSKAQLGPGINQLKALVDLCHLHGLAVILDVVYNHAGGGGPVWGLDERSLWFYDRQFDGNKNNSLYFSDQTWTGPVFAYWNDWVAQFFIDNARFLIGEYKVDGLRYDEVRVITNSGGRGVCQKLTQTVRATNASAIQIAEYWNDDRPNAVRTVPSGLGFDAEIGDQLRIALRNLLQQTTAGLSASLDLGAVGSGLTATVGDAWRLVQCLENHDLTYAGHGAEARRVPSLADPADRLSWYARSRSRAVTVLLLTAPGIPSIFMGEEFLEDKLWSDDRRAGGLIAWNGLVNPDPTMRDFQTFFGVLVQLRRNEPALRSGCVRVSRAQNFERVLVMHRWIEGSGQDVIVVVSFDERPKYGYGIGLPFGGTWRECFNSDVYDCFPNPSPAGNGGSVDAAGPPLDGFPTSALLTLPPNGALILLRA